MSLSYGNELLDHYSLQRLLNICRFDVLISKDLKIAFSDSLIKKDEKIIFAFYAHRVLLFDLGC
jgi:hypothetical protein